MLLVTCCHQRTGLCLAAPICYLTPRWSGLGDYLAAALFHLAVLVMASFVGEIATR